MFKTGEIINGRYIIRKKIGKGGMSEVYLAYDTVKKGRAALKCSGSSMPLAKEYHIMKSLNCKGVPEVFEFFVHKGAAFISLEYIEGVTLEEVIENWQISEKISDYTELAHIIISICITAYYLNRDENILYLDYKPSNIIVGVKGVFLIDFGAAIDMKDAYIRDGIAFYGTERYTAPEQKDAGRTADARTDVFQIGALMEYVIKKCGVKDKALKAIAKRCMNKRLSARFSSAKEVASLLAGCIKYNGQVYGKECKKCGDVVSKKQKD